VVQSQGELTLDGAADVVPRARGFVTAALAEEHEAVVDDARLVVTELVTNACLHGAPPIVVRVRRTDRGVRVEVQDGGHSLPLIPAHSTEAMTGRGLTLVAAVGAAWGVEPAPAGGKVVWVELVDAEHSNDAPVEPDMDIDALLAAWTDDDGADPVFTVRLGAVPTDLLLAAKSHIDNVVREATLQEGGWRGAQNPPEIAALIETVTHLFASARADIKRQALAAAARGEAETELVLTQPASAADAGERYLAALDMADRYARQARMLTLEAPPVHKVFRRWYVQALVDQLRAKAAGVEPPAARTFLQVLSDEMGRVRALEDAADRLDLLQSIASDLTGAATTQDIAAVVVDRAAEFLDAVSGRVMLIEGEALVSVTTHGGGAAAATYETVPLATELPGPVVVRSREPLVLRNNAQLAERFPALAGIYDTDRSLHVAPLIIGDHVLGVLSLSFLVGGRLDPDTQATFVRALADALAQAIERAQAMDAARVANERLSFLAEASVALGASLDFEATANAVASLLVPRLADWCVVQVLDRDMLVNVALKHFDPDRLAWAERMQGLYPVDMSAPTGAPNVIRTGQSEIYPDLPPELIEQAAQSAEHLEVLRQLGLSSAIVVPLAGRAGLFGAVTLIHAESGRHYSESDLPFVEDVARRAALALETARAFRDQSGRLADVTRVAEAAQQAILAPPPDRIGAVALAARYVSAAAEALVGGDMYEVVARPGAVRLLIGDVRGKGLAAVRTATVVLGEFRAAAADIDDLSAVAGQLDRRVRSYLDEEDFVTALIAEVADDGTYTVAICGHPPALLASRGTVRVVSGEPSLPLGLGAAPILSRGRLAAGERLLLMTDGIIEARDPDREFLDLLRLVAPLAKRGPLGPALDAVLSSLHDAVGSALGDDLALLVAEFIGPLDAEHSTRR
jgi:serine phosphatase RsbU (regulator of sigma subunit)